jgi:hypothetical protein
MPVCTPSRPSLPYGYTLSVSSDLLSFGTPPPSPSPCGTRNLPKRSKRAGRAAWCHATAHQQACTFGHCGLPTTVRCASTKDLAKLRRSCDEILTFFRRGRSPQGDGALRAVPRRGDGGRVAICELPVCRGAGAGGEQREVEGQRSCEGTHTGAEDGPCGTRATGVSPGVGHPSGLCTGQSPSAPEARGIRGLEFSSRVAYIVIEAGHRVQETTWM